MLFSQNFLSGVFSSGMLTRPAGHEAEAEARKSEDEAEAQKFFEAEATVYEAEARHVREQLSVYEHED